MRIQDTFFSFPRFVHICRKEMLEIWKRNILRILLMYGVMAIGVLWNGYFSYSIIYKTDVKVDPGWSFSLWLFVCFLVIFGCISASFMMERMRNKTNITATLMTPATMFEKYFSRWLIYTLGFLLVYLICFKLADYTRVLIYSVAYPDIETIAVTPLSALISSKETYIGIFADSKEALLFLAFYLLSQSFFVLGSTIWPKASLLKTFAALIIISTIYGMVFGLGFKLWLAENNNVVGFDLSMESQYCILISFYAFFALFNWTLGYFRFKESEIIHRM